uniref:Uncharacterized protein n=1 Tax=Arundo donax TaxID=35708 RepID=A0A0A9FXV3_ARUDO
MLAWRASSRNNLDLVCIKARKCSRDEKKCTKHRKKQKVVISTRARLT